MLMAIRDFKMWYGEAVVRRQIVKSTSGDVMTRVPTTFYVNVTE